MAPEWPMQGGKRYLVRVALGPPGCLAVASGIPLGSHPCMRREGLLDSQGCLPPR